MIICNLIPNIVLQQILRYFGSQRTSPLRHKLVVMATSLEESGKLDLVKKIHANTFLLVKRS